MDAKVQLGRLRIGGRDTDRPCASAFTRIGGMTLVSLRAASFMPFGPHRYKPLIPRYLDAAD
jgi:hypothetical protein